MRCARPSTPCIKDPAFLDEAKRQKRDIVPLRGAELAKIVEDILATPKPIRDRLATIDRRRVKEDPQSKTEKHHARTRSTLPKKTGTGCSPMSGQLAMITTVDGEGRVNAATFATCVRVVHEPVHIAFTTSTYKDTWSNVQATEAIHRQPAVVRSRAAGEGRILGLPFDQGVNEIEKAGLTALPAQRVKPPRIAECHAAFRMRGDMDQRMGRPRDDRRQRARRLG